MLVKQGYIVLLSKYKVFVEKEQMSSWVYNHFKEVDEALVIKVPQYCCTDNGDPGDYFDCEDTNSEYSNTQFRVGDTMFDIRNVVRVLYPYN